MRSLRTWFTTLLFYGYVVVSSLVAWSVFITVAPWVWLFDRSRRRLLNRITAIWCYQLVTLLPMWSCQWKGKENIGNGPYVVVANHQSFADIPVMFGLGHLFKIVSKRAIFHIPIIGWAMRINDYVELIRGDRDSAARMMEHCRRHLDAGNSVLMFPEGTRSRDGRIQVLKHGAFRLAKESGVKVLPVVLDGTGRIMPRDGYALREAWGVVVPVRVLPPLDPANFDTPAALARATRAVMAASLADIRGVDVEDVTLDAVSQATDLPRRTPALI